MTWSDDKELSWEQMLQVETLSQKKIKNKKLILMKKITRERERESFIFSSSFSLLYPIVGVESKGAPGVESRNRLNKV